MTIVDFGFLNEELFTNATATLFLKTREIDESGFGLRSFLPPMAELMKQKSSAPSLQQGASEVDDVTRALPHAVGPEKSLLSTMLQDPQEYIGKAEEEKLTAEHFYLPQHSTLFGFLRELYSAGVQVELVSLVQRLMASGLLEKCGGPGYLTDLYTYARRTYLSFTCCRSFHASPAACEGQICPACDHPEFE